MSQNMNHIKSMKTIKHNMKRRASWRMDSRRRLAVSFCSLVSAALLLLPQVSSAQTNVAWAVRAGGTLSDATHGVAVNSVGDVFLIGLFQGTMNIGSTNLTSQGSYDVCVAKLDRDGNLLWATSFGGSGDDETGGIALDGEGNAYIVGRFSGTASFGGVSLTSSGGADIFIAKVDSNGKVIWARKAGGAGDDSGWNIAVDAQGNSYITGVFSQTATFGTNVLTSAGQHDIFVAMLDRDGNFVRALRIGGTGEELTGDVAVNSAGELYVCGSFLNTVTIGTNTLVSGGSYDAFVAKADAAGNWLWAAKTSGAGDERGGVVLPDGMGNVYLAGGFNGAGIFGSTNINSPGGWAGLLAKLDDSGHFLWARGMFGTDLTHGTFVHGLVRDGAEGVYADGSFSGTATFGGSITLTAQFIDAFVARYTGDGDTVWALRMGGSGEDNGESVTRDSFGGLYVCGNFAATAGFGNVSLTSRGYGDMFLVRLTGPAPVFTSQPQSQTVTNGASVTFSATAEGEAPLAYQWRKGGFALSDGGNITGATSPTLNLGNVQAGDSGAYSLVVIANGGGAATSQVAALTVLMPPSIPGGLASQVVSPGQGTVLTVTAAGGEPLSYQWQLNGTNIDGATGPSLALSSVKCAEAGVYSVIVRNPVGTASATATVSLLGLQMYAGLTICGQVGTPYRVEYADALSGGTNWQTLVNIPSLPTSPYLFFDVDSPNAPKRFYRAVPSP